MRSELLSIGQFAQLCRLTVKQLRNYDGAGLLHPAEVDRFSGYRYYRPDQAPAALTIALLRGQDVPLSTIAQYLTADRDTREKILDRERDRVAERIARDQRRWKVLNRLSDIDDSPYEVALEDQPELALATIEFTCRIEDIGLHTGRAIGRLFTALEGARWSPPVHGLYPGELTEQVDMAVGVAAGTAPPGTVARLLSAGPAACVIHIGDYAELPLAYHAVFAWIHARRLRPRGQVRETYLVGPTQAPPSQLVTALTVPVAPPQQATTTKE